MTDIITSTNPALLEEIQLKIHNHMKATVPGYNAERWATVRKHPTKNLYMIKISSTDSRNPLDVIKNDNHKIEIMDVDDWTPNIL